mmetsp:Transcript_5927/g.8381  ORF Transcript_5927/g.8381 Transcript_5927/m.8381 type:complete len:290 (+) Transcript_5927:157-1026(+)
MADDDLDAFFDEVSAVEAQVQVEDEKPSTEKDQDGKSAELLETYLNEKGRVGSVDANKTDVEPPPLKKIKTGNGSTQSSRQPLGVVVASATSVISVSAVPAAISSPVLTRTVPAPQPKVPTSAPTSTTDATLYPSSVPNPQHPPLPPGPPPPPPPAGPLGPSKPHKRSAAGKTWVDPTLDQWPENDFRIFVGNIPKDVADNQLHDHFSSKYNSAVMAKIVRDAKGSSKGYGFVSFLEPMEMARALREMDQTWLASRPIRVKRSDWKEKELKNVNKKQKHFKKQQKRKGW